MAATTTPEQAIQQFILLGKNLKGKNAAQLISQAISHPYTYVFGEMLDLEGIRGLKNDSDPENQKAYNLLELFAYGTYSDWKQNVSQYPELTAEQKLKLKQLTVVNFSSKQRILPYATLMRELDINDVRQLEDMLIDCIYQGLIEGKLDQSQQSLEVYEAIGRDFKFSDLDIMIQVLHEWSGNAKKVLTALDTCSKRAIEQFEQAKKHKKEHESKVEEIEKTIKTTIEAQNESNTGAALIGMGMSFHEDKSARRMNQKRNR